MKVSVIVPTYNEEEYLPKLLECLKSQTLDEFEIIVVHSRLFHRVGGFDERVKHAEDFDLIRRAAKLRPFRVLHSASANVSVRRYRKEGCLAFIGHSLAVSWHRTVKGEITEDFDYEFGDFDESDKNGKPRKLEKGINRFSRTLNRMSK